MLLKRTTILLSFLFTSLHLLGQNRLSEQTWGIDAKYKTGFLIAHRAIMGHLPTDPTHAAELSMFIETNGSKVWHKAMKYPQIGFTLYGGTAGNRELMGDFYGAYGFIDIPIVKTKIYQFSGKLGCGLGYATKTYDPITNPKDVAISTPINALLCVGVKSSFRFGLNRVSLGLDMTHFSNGAFETPNLGINLPFVSIGYERTLNRVRQLDTTKHLSVTPWKKWLINLTLIGSAKEVFPTNGKKYPVIALNASARWFAKPKVGMEHGVDFISKQSVMDYNPEIEKSQWDIFQIGIYSAYLLPLDQFHFVFGMGAYLKDKYSPENIFYHRIGMRYYLKNGINFNLVLKSHWAKADYVEWGVGYSFNYRKK